MFGVVVNVIVIVVCSLAGFLFIKKIPSGVEESVKKAIGLFAICIGIRGALDCQRVLLMLISLTGGAAIGELIRIDSLVNRLGAWAEKRLNMGGGGEERSFSKAFVSYTILSCTGSIVIVGSLQSGLTGNHELLFMKSAMDGVGSLIFSASMGIGVAFSAIPVFICEGGIVLLSGAVKEFLTPEIIREMSAVGCVLVAATGFNFLSIKEIRVANFIPAVFIPLVYMLIEGYIPRFY